jgi:hypothetical protein
MSPRPSRALALILLLGGVPAVAQNVVVTTPPPPPVPAFAPGVAIQQPVVARAGSPVLTGPVSAWPTGMVTYTSHYASPVVGSTAPVYGNAIVTTYSYTAVAPAPARYYVGLGTPGDFPFYGQPYGSPNDRWTWGYMSGERRLDRYYYPPVP